MPTITDNQRIALKIALDSYKNLQLSKDTPVHENATSDLIERLSYELGQCQGILNFISLNFPELEVSNER